MRWNGKVGSWIGVDRLEDGVRSVAEQTGIVITILARSRRACVASSPPSGELPRSFEEHKVNRKSGEENIEGMNEPLEQ